MYKQVLSSLERKRPILLDGAMGTELVRRGVRWHKHGLLTDAPAVRELHAEYLTAGADVIRTNTFQLNPRIYLNVFRNSEHMRHIGAPGLHELAERLLRISVQLAREAMIRTRRDGSAVIAGVLSPLEHCFRPDMAPPADVARREHQAQAQVFAEEKVDLLLLDGMNTIREAKAALKAGLAVGLPVWVGFVLGPEGDLLSREPLLDAVVEIEREGADAVFFTAAPPADIAKALRRMKGSCSLPCGGLAQIGRFSPPSWKFEFFPQFIDTDEWPAERYASEAYRWREDGASLLGGGFGTSPQHIAALRAKLDHDDRSPGR